MRKTLITLFCFCLGLQLLHAQRNPELSLDPSKAEWFREAKFGMFIHWGLYSMLEGSYNGRTLPDKSLRTATVGMRSGFTHGWKYLSKNTKN